MTIEPERVGRFGFLIGSRNMRNIVARIRRRSGQRVVVGSVVIRDGQVLGQQRSYPPSLRGQWEFPGGNVDPGETDRQALARECMEEMRIRIAVLGQVGPDVPLPGKSDKILRLYEARLLSGSQEPRALEHMGVRWFTVTELGTVKWLPADEVILPHIVALLLKTQR